MKVQLIALCLALGGCVCNQPKEDPIVVYKPVDRPVPVKVPCLKAEQIPAEPAYALDDPEIKGKSFEEKGNAAIKELEQRRAWQREARALLEGCVKPVQ